MGRACAKGAPRASSAPVGQAMKHAHLVGTQTALPSVCHVSQATSAAELSIKSHATEAPSRAPRVKIHAPHVRLGDSVSLMQKSNAHRVQSTHTAPADLLFAPTARSATAQGSATSNVAGLPKATATNVTPTTISAKLRRGVRGALQRPCWMSFTVSPKVSPTMTGSGTRTSHQSPPTKCSSRTVPTGPRQMKPASMHAAAGTAARW